MDRAPQDGLCHPRADKGQEKCLLRLLQGTGCQPGRSPNSLYQCEAQGVWACVRVSVQGPGCVCARTCVWVCGPVCVYVCVLVTLL